MKPFRKMRLGKRLIKAMVPILHLIAESCPDCGNDVIMWFDHKAKFKPYYPAEETCTQCSWRRPYSELVREHNGLSP